MKDAELTQEVVRELLDYNPETGIMTWKERDRKWFKSEKLCNAWNRHWAGKEAGHIKAQNHKGGYQYRRIKLLQKGYQIHRLIWLWVTGQFPEDCVDHVNRDATDNRWCNLRAVSRADNNLNISKMRSNTSGATGVSWDKRSRNWVAKCWYRDKYNYLGCFAEDDFESAVKAVQDFRREHGFSEDHGKEYAHYYKGDNE